VRRLALALASRAELIDTSVRVCQENERLQRELTQCRASLLEARAAYASEQRRVRQLRNDLADLQEFLAIIPFGEVS
jgi:hypothetical protein